MLHLNRHVRHAPSKRNSKRKKASDIWPFIDKVFEDGQEKRHCRLCRELHAHDSQKPLQVFSKDTSTGTLRAHLSREHLGAWITACDELNIKIGGKDVQRLVERYRAETGGCRHRDGGWHSTTTPASIFD
ncbi:hypothetical protein C8F01DRAFT_38449 [Mycena amicta]|nr:hypothetical protein C8F01DRAFT_38449 [Mycena amicta]